MKSKKIFFGRKLPENRRPFSKQKSPIIVEPLTCAEKNQINAIFP
jgi:hypothetical protein